MKYKINYGYGLEFDMANITIAQAQIMADNGLYPVNYIYEEW